jgi:hypothetical protein
MLNDLATELDKLVVRHRGLGLVDIPVEYLRVFDPVLAPGTDRNDVIERSGIRGQQPAGQRAPILLPFE